MLELQARREKHGWSRAELARRAGLNAATVGAIERGRLVPYETQLAKLAGALKVPVRKASILMEEASSDVHDSAR